MYLFFLFVSVEKINLINYDDGGVGVFFSCSACVRNTEKTRRKGRLMLVCESVELRIFEIYDAIRFVVRDGPDAPFVYIGWRRRAREHSILNFTRKNVFRASI